MNVSVLYVCSLLKYRYRRDQLSCISTFNKYTHTVNIIHSWTVRIKPIIIYSSTEIVLASTFLILVILMFLAWVYIHLSFFHIISSQCKFVQRIFLYLQDILFNNSRHISSPFSRPPALITFLFLSRPDPLIYSPKQSKQISKRKRHKRYDIML